jgi:tRNA(adenine34) deaminase
MCAGAIGWSQADALVYGADDEKKGYTKVIGQLLHPKTTVKSGILSASCSEIITKFFKKKRSL